MAVVTVKTFLVQSRDPIIQGDVDAVSTSVNTFLAGLDPANVLDIKPTYMPTGKYGSVTFAITVVYLV